MGEHNDFALALGLLVLGGLGTVLWYFIRGKFATYDEQHKLHFQHSSQTAIHQDTMSRETLELSLKNINDRMDQHAKEDQALFLEVKTNREEIRRTLHWLGDCMLRMAVTMKVDLPERPE